MSDCFDYFGPSTREFVANTNIDALVLEGGNSAGLPANRRNEHFRDLMRYDSAMLIDKETKPYHGFTREVTVQIEYLPDDTTNVKLTERFKAPATNSTTIFSTQNYRGMIILSLNQFWQALARELRPVERRLLINLPASAGISADVRFAEEAAEMLEAQYETMYRRAMEETPLVDMILTRIVRHEYEIEGNPD